MADRETIETSSMNDRELMLNVYHRTTEIAGSLATLNGTVADHNQEIYGSDEKKETGIKSTVKCHDHDLRTGKTIIKTILGIISLIGVGNLVAWVTIAAQGG